MQLFAGVVKENNDALLALFELYKTLETGKVQRTEKKRRKKSSIFFLPVSTSLQTLKELAESVERDFVDSKNGKARAEAVLTEKEFRKKKKSRQKF